MSTERKKQMEAAWRASAESARQLETLRDILVRFGCYDEAHAAGVHAEQSRDWCRKIYNYMEAIMAGESTYVECGLESLCSEDAVVRTMIAALPVDTTHRRVK